MKYTLAKTNQEWSERLRAKNEDLLNIAKIIAARVQLCPRVCDNNPPQARIIGGFVRDSLLGLDSLDMDIEVYGTRPIDLFAALQDLFPQHIRLLGKSYQVLQIQTHDHLKLEINIPRSRWDEDRRCFFAGDPYRTPLQAAASREFICNSAQADPLTGEIFDYLNARQEFEEGVLRVQEPKNFYFNPICVFRVLHFNTRFGLNPHPETLELMQRITSQGRLQEIHPRRIAGELEKVFLLGTPASAALKLMRQALIFTHLFTAIDVSDSIYSAAIWESTLTRIDRVQSQLIETSQINDSYIANTTMYSALLFDSLWNSYRRDFELIGTKAETTVRRLANEFFHFLQFDHPTLKRNFPKLISSLLLIHTLTQDLSKTDITKHSTLRRRERLKPRAQLANQNSPDQLQNRVKQLILKLRPLDAGETLTIYDLITRNNPKHVPTKAIREILQLAPIFHTIP